MKIIMTLLVKNEDDIIEDNIIFHHSIGVDLFIITDHNSSDNTPNILKKFSNIAIILKESSNSYDQPLWVSNMAKLAHSLNADWIINNDADEFWLPDSLNLKSFFQTFNNSNIYKIHTPRFDFIYRPFKNTKFYNALLFRESSHKWTKCCHRASHDISVEMGNHNAHSNYFSSLNFSHYFSNSLKILHFPIRNPHKYVQKILSSTPLLLNTPNLNNPNFGFHWKNLFNLISSNPNIKPDDLFPPPSAQQINEAIKNNSLSFDDSLQKFFLSHP